MASASSSLTVATFNVNSIKSRIGLVHEWLQKTHVDILALQELKTEENKFPFAVFEELGFSCAVFGQKTYNGVAICSRLPFEEIKAGFGDPHLDEQKRLLYARIGNIHLINVYAPHGDYRGEPKYRYKLNFFQSLSDYLADNFSPHDPVCLVGDLNVAPTDLDVWDAEALKDSIGTMPEEREAFQKLLDWGLYDTFRFRYPELKKFSWWDYQQGAVWKDQGMRIDHILVTAPLLDQIEEIAIDTWPRRRRKPTPSDHAPVILTLKTATFLERRS